MSMQQCAEAAGTVLGQMLADQNVIGPVLAVTQADDFLLQAHRQIYEAIRRLFSEGRPVDGLTVDAETCGAHHNLLAELLNLVTTTATAEAHAQLLHNLARQERMRDIALEISGEQSAEKLQQLVDKLAAENCEKPGLKVLGLSEGLTAFYDRHMDGKKPEYLQWGMALMDQILFVEPGDMVVLGGYPSAGKSAMALQLGWNLAKGKKRVGYFFLENSADKLMDRLLSCVAQVSFSRIKQHTLEESDFEAIANAHELLMGAQLQFIDAAGMSVADVRAVTLSRRYDVIIVDYLQKLRGSGAKMTDFERVSQISSDLQTLGRQNGVVVLALSQLTRPDNAKGKQAAAPTMHSFRQSGQIEQDADVAMLLYKQDDNNPQSPRTLKIGKNKEGEAGIAFTMYFDGDRQTFMRFSKQTPPPPKAKDEHDMSVQEWIQKYRVEDGMDPDMPF